MQDLYHQPYYLIPPYMNMLHFIHVTPNVTRESAQENTRWESYLLTEAGVGPTI